MNVLPLVVSYHIVPSLAPVGAVSDTVILALPLPVPAGPVGPVTPCGPVNESPVAPVAPVPPLAPVGPDINKLKTVHPYPALGDGL